VDCEKFDRIVLDLLYDELDELTSAAARRHMEHCTRCRGIGAGLRATREVGTLPLVDPPEGLELRILEAEQRATNLMPLRKRLGRGVSLLAGYAMRPQLAMAALLMLMIGSSLFFLRAQPGDREHVLVTERGVPESDNDPVGAIVPKKSPASALEPALEPEASRLAPRAGSRADDALPRRERAVEAKSDSANLDSPSPGAAGALRRRAEPEPFDGLAESTAEPATDSDASYEAALASYRDGRYSEAERRFGEIANQNGAHAANAALYEVQALRMVSGCPTAAPRFEDVHTRYPGAVGNSAAWQAADCYRSLGELARARQNYDELAADPSYKSRASEAIAELDQRAADEASAHKAGAAPAAKPTASAPAKPSTPEP
jgi:TolA-binding protein